MFKYLVQTSDGMLLTKLTRDVHPDWRSNTEFILEREEDIPSDEVGFWSWNGSELVVNELLRYKFRCFKKANKWMKNRLPTVSWSNLTEIEKKYVMRTKLSDQDVDNLLVMWTAAGSPEE